MKTYLKSPIIALLVTCVILFSACSEEDDSTNNTTTNEAANQLAQQVETSMETGTWIITKFIDSGNDETNHFNSYTFSFNTDGSLVANNGTTTVSGSWSVAVDNSSGNSSDDDSSSSDDSNDVDFNIVFISPADFEELSDDWDIISNTDSKIELIDISGGNGGTDYLTFQKS